MTPEAIEQLSQPLQKSAISERKNYAGGGMLSYIETHHAIREANRIFGFNGWSRETVQVERIATTPYSKDGVEMIAVSYMARVRITVGNVVREGCGYGDGQSRVDKAGAAHKLAIKEAESDATKRALTTFGDPFGLALYEKDKKKRNVSSDTPEPKLNPKAQSRTTFDGLVTALRKLQSESQIDRWENMAAVKEARLSLPESWKGNLADEINQQREGIRANAQMDREARVEV